MEIGGEARKGESMSAEVLIEARRDSSASCAVSNGLLISRNGVILAYAKRYHIS